jgi:Mn2+/Fe2+ NRAMP family transporter
VTQINHVDAEKQRPSSLQLVAAVLLFSLGVAITCARFPPADAAGWIARSLNVPLGVPFLIAALLFGGVVRLVNVHETRFRLLRRISLIAAIVCALIGIFAVSVEPELSAPTRVGEIHMVPKQIFLQASGNGRF